jgi:1-hydroxycarotenoid 3,4-desaturase
LNSERIVIVGAGIAGIVAALELAWYGMDVTVLERGASAGGKLTEVAIGEARLDTGPTVFTMRDTFEQMFSDVGETLSSHLTLRPAELLARHAWGPRARLDLFADPAHTADAIGRFSSLGDAKRYLAFCTEARLIYETLESSFIQQPRPSLPGMISRVGINNFSDLWRLNPYATMWKALGRYFHDPRLRQLFGRFATYCGSSPFEAPATLMLVAHVEQSGVWLVDGGMQRLVEAITALAEKHGATFRYKTHVDRILLDDGRVSGVVLDTGERIEADAAVVNADSGALAAGLLGGDVAAAAPRIPPGKRSLSAMTWAMVAKAEGFPLVRHNVFFSSDYTAEFDDIFRHSRLPFEPTVYVCAQDRADREGRHQTPSGPERLLCIINAPANGDGHRYTQEEIGQCEQRVFSLLERQGLRLRRHPDQTMVSTPADFERRFPGTGGAIYGAASHGWRASFNRPGSQTKIPGLYLAGGSVHPGPGVPMAVLSGRSAAQSIIQNSPSSGPSRRGAMPGGTSTH